MERGSPFPACPVNDAVADRMRAPELLSSYMDVPEVEALRARLVPLLPEPSAEPAHTSHWELAQDLADKCERQEKMQALLSEKRSRLQSRSVLLRNCSKNWSSWLGKLRIWMKTFLS